MVNGLSVIDDEILRYTQDDRLRRVNYEFKIFCSNKDLDGSFLQGVAFDEWVPYNAHTKVWYSSSGIILPVLQQQIKKEKPDHLFITGIYDWQFNGKPLLFCRGVKKIVSVRGMLHPGALSQKGFKKKIYLGLWKMLGLHKEAVFHATDEQEKKYIQQVFGASVNVKVAANFPNVLDIQPVVQKEPGQLKLVSVALISAMKNILLVIEALGSGQLATGGSFDDEILPIAESDVDRFAQQTAVHSRQDDSLRGEGGGRQETGGGSGEVSIEYNIYGPIKDQQYWEACEAQIKKLPPNITVNYHGDIAPGKIVDALAANHVFILPSKSENYGHAIYEAMSAGRPVITSNTTPWNHLQTAKAGMNVSLTDTTELVQAITLFAAMTTEELKIWSTGASLYAKEAVDMDAVRRQYEELFS
jgi:glycosyltransferase involved in cell wall biosynthesis